MPRTIEGTLLDSGGSFAIVVSRFNSFITERLLEGALDGLARHGVSDDRITVVRCPGAFELPLVASRLASSGLYHAVICLGAVIRGSTSHFDYVAGESAKGLAHVALKADIPVVFGVLTTDSIEQAIERAGTKHGNKGWEAAATAMEMVNLLKSIG